MAKLRQMLGNGIYTVSEAALYARVAPQMMARWLFGSRKGNAVLIPQFPSEEKLVSFLDLVQTLAIREIRLQRKVPLIKFRQAIKVAKEHFGMDYPFARRHCTYLLDDQLVIKPAGKDMYVEASGPFRGQPLFNFVEMYLEQLTFSAQGLAKLYRIYKCENDVAINMNPEMRFGEPLLPSGYSATTIWDAIKVEGGLEEAGRAYGIPTEEVEAAYRFFVDYLGKSAA